MDIVITPEQIERAREQLMKHRLRYKPKRIQHRGFNLSDEYVIKYIKKYVEDRDVKSSKYFNHVGNMNESNFSNYKIFKPKHELEMTDRLKNEVLTGYVSFTI